MLQRIQLPDMRPFSFHYHLAAGQRRMLMMALGVALIALSTFTVNVPGVDLPDLKDIPVVRDFVASLHKQYPHTTTDKVFWLLP